MPTTKVNTVLDCSVKTSLTGYVINKHKKCYKCYHTTTARRMPSIELKCQGSTTECTR